MRIARDFGDVSQVLPEGITLKDVPFQLFDAIRQGLVFLSFQEYPEDERPDRKIWNDPEALEEHFKVVKKKREEMMDPNKSGPIEDPVDNAAAKGLLVGE